MVFFRKYFRITRREILIKKLLVILLCLALLPGVSALGEEAAPTLSRNLIILFTSDVHCGVDRGWGYAGVYAIKENLSKNNYVLLADNGDAIQGEPIGTMSRGESIIDIMNAVGYDFAIPGNHEFVYGMDQFLELTKRANYPYLSCNFNKEGELVLPPYLIREFDGVKIAFVGVTTPMTPRSSMPRYFMDENGNFIYGFMEDTTGEALYNAVQNAVDDARAEGAAYVILMAHLGNEEEVIPWRFNDVIEHTTGIDALLDGHSHDTNQETARNKNGEEVVRIGCGTKLEGVGALTITPDGKITAELYSWGASLSAEQLLGIDNPGKSAVAEETAKLSDTLGHVVASSAVELYVYDPTARNTEGKPVRIIRQMETNLGDLCADAYLDESGDADIALVNGGGIRVNIGAGDITLNDILKVHPYGNSLTVIEATGQQILDALEWSVHSLPGEFGGFDQVAGLTFEARTSIPSPCVSNDQQWFDHIDESMERRVRNVMIGGEAIDPEKTYKVVSHNYQLLEHGDGYTMFDGCNVLRESVKLDNQVLIDYIVGTLGGVVSEGYENPYGQGRIVVVD